MGSSSLAPAVLIRRLGGKSELPWPLVNARPSLMLSAAGERTMPNRAPDLPALLALLGLSPPCDAKDIQRARRAQSKEFHPDRAPEGEQSAFLERMKAINAAADDLLEYCAQYGAVRAGHGRAHSQGSEPRSEEQQYNFWRDRWREEEQERQAWRERRAQAEQERREAERERMRREYEEYRERRRRSHSDDEREQRAYERSRAAARRALVELEQLRARGSELAVSWEEAQARLAAAVAAFKSDSSSDSALWRLYGAFFACYAVGSDYRNAIRPIVSTWNEHADVLTGAGLADADRWNSILDESTVRQLATQQFTVDLGVDLADSLEEALTAADQRMVSRTSPAARRALGAILEIRRILALDGARDDQIKAYWTSPTVAPLNLAMGEVKRTVAGKGFVFVTRYGGGKDVFLHATALPPGVFDQLVIGTVLTYRVKETEKGLQATDAELVSSPADADN